MLRRPALLAAPVVPAVLVIARVFARVFAETNLPDLGTVVPTVAGTGLLLVIVRLLLTERGQRRALEADDRKRWENERASLIAEHRVEVDRLRKEIDELYGRLRREGS